MPGEYCQYLDNGQPLFRTVGNDATFYRPPTASLLRKYLNQIPEDFEMCFKVWEELTIPVYANHLRYGRDAGTPNPHFLNAKLFMDLVLMPYRDAKFEPHTGPFVFEFQRHGMAREEFCSKLDQFFQQLPKDFRYAVEIRNAGVLGFEYRQVLDAHGVAHVYNHWSYMPSLAEQHQRAEAPARKEDTRPRCMSVLAANTCPNNGGKLSESAMFLVHSHRYPHNQHHKPLSS